MKSLKIKTLTYIERYDNNRIDISLFYAAVWTRRGNAGAIGTSDR